MRIVDDISTLSLDTTNGDDFTLIYNGNGAPPLEQGYILVGTEGKGYLRRVSVVKSWHTKAYGAKSVYINTEFYSLNEVIDSGELELADPVVFTKSNFEKGG